MFLVKKMVQYYSVGYKHVVAITVYEWEKENSIFADSVFETLFE
jgi:hypothetical protein